MKCGGCRDLGAHARWCPEVVGHKASKLGQASEQADALGDFIGSTDPALANAAYVLAMRLLAAAILASRKGHAL